MKYIRMLIVLFLLCGCTQAAEEEAEPEEEGTVESYLLSLPEKPSEEDGIFVCANDGLHYEEIWDEFLEKTENEEVCEVTVGRYTIEGDVIYELLVHDGERFILYTDNSRDQFGKSEGIGSESRSFLYDMAYVTNEKSGDQIRSYMNRFAFLSDEDLKDEEEVMAFLDEHREGKDDDMVTVWTIQYLMK